MIWKRDEQRADFADPLELSSTATGESRRSCRVGKPSRKTTERAVIQAVVSSVPGWEKPWRERFGSVSSAPVRKKQVNQKETGAKDPQNPGVFHAALCFTGLNLEILGVSKTLGKSPLCSIPKHIPAFSLDGAAFT